MGRAEIVADGERAGTAALLQAIRAEAGETAAGVPAVHARVAPDDVASPSEGVAPVPAPGPTDGEHHRA